MSPVTTFYVGLFFLVLMSILNAIAFFIILERGYLFVSNEKFKVND